MRIYATFFSVVIFLFVLSCSTDQEKSQKTDYLLAFAKSYGYLKYFYPSDEVANLDWDKFGAWASKQLLESPNPEKKMEEIFYTIAPAIQFHQPDKRIITPAFLDGINLETAVFWQHIGNGKGSVGPNYKSIRLNRPASVLPDSPNDYGVARFRVPVDSIIGKNVKISAMVRLSANFQGRASIILRTKQKDQAWKQHASEGQEIGDGNWKKHEVEAKIPPNLDRAILYLQNVGMTGAVDFDEVQLSFEEQGIWKELLIPNASFNEPFTEDDEEWSSFGPNQDFTIQKEKENNFLHVNRTKGVLQTIPPLFEPMLPEKMMLTKQLNSQLALSFPIVLRLQDSVVTPGVNEVAFQELQQSVQGLEGASINLKNPAVRVANLIKVWNVFQHFYPYFDRLAIDWEMELKQALEKNETDQSTEDHVETLKLMIAPLEDSHLGVYANYEDFFPPVFWDKVESAIVVTHVLDTNLSIQPGDEVLTINGLSAETYWEQALARAQGANLNRKAYRAIGESLIGTKNQPLKIEVQTKDGMQVFELEHTISEGTFNRAMKKQADKIYEVLGEDIHYIHLSNITWDFLQEKLVELSKAKGIIFDLRGYPSWQTMNIVSHFIKDTVNQVSTFTPHILYPDQESLDFRQNEQAYLTPKQPFIAAPKVFLTESSAISYSETFLNLISHYKLANIVGRQTAGSTGNTNNIYLYGGILIPWTGMKVLDQNGNPFHGKGVEPDYPLAPSINGITNGEDEQLALALDILNR